MTSTALLLRVALARGGNLVAKTGGGWQRACNVHRAFRLHRRERDFARELLATRTNLWLYRCHQRGFCGDFIVVDRSAAPGRPLRCWAVELKLGACLRLGRRGQQLARCDAAARELADVLGFELHGPMPVVGGRRAVLELL